MLDATLLLLAGGESRRMGRSKARLPVAGTTLLDWQLRRLGGTCREVLVSGEGGLPDLRPGRLGPLAGIEAGLAAAATDAVLVVAVDLPRVESGLLTRLLEASAGHDAAAPRLSGRPEPACACYRKTALAVVSRRLDRGRLKAADALAELDTAWLEDVPAEQLWNLNTQQDYQVFLSEL